jgi:phosphate:Na+ symporter
MFAGKEKIKYLGGIIAGLGILFIGMNMMSDAMMPLRESERFISLMTKFSNPFFGIMSGMLFTAIIQSSSASVGILQALAVSGLIGLDGAVFVLFGQNIGTCITAVLASIGTNINARRTTIIHLMFNIIGTIVFTVICLVTPFTSWMISFVPDNPAAQIANVHTIFNITTTILLMPFGGRMAHAAELILPDQGAGGKKRDEDAWFDEIVATQHVLGVSAMAIQSLKDEVQVMLKLASENVEASFGAIERMGEGGIKEIEKREDAIDQMNVHLSRKVAKALTVEHGYGDVMSINHLFKIVGNIERIGDHAMNLAEYAVLIKEKDIHLSQEALDEVHQMKEVCMKALNELIDTRQLDRRQVLGEAVVFEQQIDDTNFQYRENQMERLRKGTCNVESSIIYSEMLTDYERIGDHILNIAKSYVML